MKFNNQTKCLCLVVVLGVFFITSCHKDQRSGWNTQMLVPIATSSLSLTNLVKDSSLKANKDSSLTLAYQSTLYSFNIADQIVKIPDTSIGQKFTIDSLRLANIDFTYSLSLGAIANNMAHSSNPQNSLIGQLIIAQNHQHAPVQAFSGIPPISSVFNLGSYFDSAQLTTGILDVKITNGLPVTINGFCTFTNQDGTILNAPGTGITVGPNDYVYFQIPMAGKFITANDTLTISNLSTPGSAQPVLIDTSNKIQINVFANTLKVSEAWAKFPEQTVIDQTTDVTQIIKDRKLTYIEAHTGDLHIHIANSVPQPLYLQYTLVGAFNNLGQPLIEYTTVPPAPPGSFSAIDTVINITGYSINLTGKNGSAFNTYTQRIIARIESTGQTQHITTADSLNIQYKLEGITPNYLKGYAGTDDITANDSAAFSFLNIFKSGSINLQDVNMNFNIINGVGVGGQVKINGLQAYSPINGMRTLTSSLLGQPLNIAPATDFPLTPAVSNYVLNNSNSNIKDLLGILPTELLYNVEVKTNTNGNSHQYRDFAYFHSNMSIGLNAEVPLSLIANHLVLKDTINFNLSNTQTNVNSITDGTIYLITENKYPIDANITMVIYDGNWNAPDTLFINQTIAAADLDNSCRANQPKKSVLQKFVDQNVVNKLKQGQYAIITADFSTPSSNTLCNGQHLKIYSDYTLGITLSAKFNYQVGTKF